MPNASRNAVNSLSRRPVLAAAAQLCKSHKMEGTAAMLRNVCADTARCCNATTPTQHTCQQDLVKDV